MLKGERWSRCSPLHLSPSYIKPQFPAVNFFITLELKARGGLFTPLPDEFIHLKWGFVSWELAHSLNVPGGSHHIRVSSKWGWNRKLYTQLCVCVRVYVKERDDVSWNILVTLPKLFSQASWFSLSRKYACMVENTDLKLDFVKIDEIFLETYQVNYIAFWNTLFRLVNSRIMQWNICVFLLQECSFLYYGFSNIIMIVTNCALFLDFAHIIKWCSFILLYIC